MRKRVLNPAQTLAVGYIIIVLLGAGLLSMPFSSSSEIPVKPIDALFTSVSATCITGLTVLDISHDFSVFGQVVILCLIQIGGLGFMTLATTFAWMIGKRMAFRHQITLKESINYSSLQGLKGIVRGVIWFTLLIEGVGFVGLSWLFSHHHGWSEAWYLGLFHSISLFNNAGFTLSSAWGTDVGSHPLFLFTASFLVIAGGLGFVVVYELWEKGIRFRSYSLHSKLVLSMTTILLAVGTLGFYVFEYAHLLEKETWTSKWAVAFFHSMTTRSGGVSTLDLSGGHDATLVLLLFLMVVGGSPGSAAGGIKTTTFAAVVALCWSQIRGRDETVLFRKKLSSATLNKAVTITMGAVLIMVSGILLLSLTDPYAGLTSVSFEIVSAFSTVGLSLGLTDQLSDPGKIVVMMMMFLGRVGLFTFSYALSVRMNKQGVEHPEETITIG